MPTPVSAVLFDLDGTLLDTAPDMGAALNRLCAAHGRPELTMEVIRPHVSNGSRALVKLGFGELDDDRNDALMQHFLALYEDSLCIGTALFDGAEHVLDTLERSGLGWGIVTNKPAYLAEPLLMKLDLYDRAGCVVCGDTVEQRKPHPMPLHHAADLLIHRTDACAYVGDAERDIQAGNAAGMRTLIARYGYLDGSEPLEDWNADAIIDAPDGVLTWLDNTRGEINARS